MKDWIAFFKYSWFWFLCVGLGVAAFLNSPLEEFSLVGKVAAFLIWIVVLPLVAYGIYDYLADSVRPIRFGCLTFLVDLFLWNNLPLEETAIWVKLLLGAILFLIVPFLVQLMVALFSDDKKEE